MNKSGNESIDLLIYHLAFPPTGINLQWREKIKTAGGTRGLLTQIIRKGTPLKFEELSQGRKLEWETVLILHRNSTHITV